MFCVCVNIVYVNKLTVTVYVFEFQMHFVPLSQISLVFMNVVQYKKKIYLLDSVININFKL